MTKSNDWLGRVEQERIELLDKIGKLRSFIESDAYDRLPLEDREDLKIQLNSMEIYVYSLERRMNREYNRRNAVKTLG